MPETNLQGTDIIIEAQSPQIGSVAKEKLSSIVSKIDSLFQSVGRVTANSPIDRVVNVGPAVVTLHNGTKRSLAPIDGNEITYLGGTIDFGTGVVTGGGASLTLPTMTSSFFIKALIELTTTNLLIVTFGAENATSNGATLPAITKGRIPLVVINLEDDGTGGQGNYVGIAQSSFQVFELGSGSNSNPNHNDTLNIQGGTATELFHLTQAQHTQVIDLVNTDGILVAGAVSTSGSSKSVDIAPGSFYVEGNTKLEILATNINLDTGNVTGSNFNQILISLDSFGVINTTAGIENSLLASVVLPAFPVEEMPLAIVTIQGDGGGSIALISAQDIEDARPVYNMGRGHLFKKTVSFNKGASIASASNLILDGLGNYYEITGSTPIDSIATIGVGTKINLHFIDPSTINNDTVSGNIQIPGGANESMFAGDEAELIEYAVGKWRLSNHQTPPAVIAGPPPASETTSGVVELATPAETALGIDSTRAVHSLGLKAVIDGISLGLGSNQVDIIANKTLLPADANTTFTNLGATGPITFSLPDITTVFGKTYTFVKLVGQDIIIQASTLDKIADSIAGGVVQNTVASGISSFIRVSALQTGLSSGLWVMSDGFGTWNTI